MKHFYNTMILLFLLPIAVSANNDKFKGKYTKEKKINKEYTVNANAGLKVNNSYGSINITTWNQNKTVIDVVIKTNGNNEERVAEKLKEIDVEFSANGSLVSAKTRFGDRKNNWSSWWGKGKNNVSVEVNYTIKLPVGNSVNLNNDYGSISIDKLEGNAKINCDYGQLIIGELLAENNALNFDYTDNSTISYMKSGSINADYSGFTVDKAESLNVNADYTKSAIGEIKTLNFNNDYGKITIDNVETLQGRGDHLSQKIGAVTKAVNLNSDYGGITIDRLASTCIDVTLKGSYTSVKLGVASNYTANFIFNLSYTGVNGEELLNITKKNDDGASKLWNGTIGSSSSGNSMNINMNYGNLKLNKN